jgi:hypothetical protein
MKILSKTLLVFLLSFAAFSSCKKEEEAKGIDQEMLQLARVSTGYTWFKNTPTLLNKSSGSGHPQPFLRTRYNTIAAASLDSSGKIISGTNFAEGSLIVKELYNNTTTFGRYAMLYKKSASAEADANGWVWGYINADGSVAEPASNKGTSCISCHSQTDNIDYMLMNKYFP